MEEKILFDAIKNNESEFVQGLLYEGANVFELNNEEESEWYR